MTLNFGLPAPQRLRPESGRSDELTSSIRHTQQENFQG
jgi:hypothetical protein